MTEDQSVSAAIRRRFPDLAKGIADEVAEQFGRGIPIVSMRDGEIVVRQKGQPDEIAPAASKLPRSARRAA